LTKDEIQTVFDQELKDTLFTKPEVLKFIIDHERKGLCLDNLHTQIRLAEFTTFPRKETIFQLIKDFARTFAKVALDQKEQDLLSAAEKKRLESKAHYLKDAETTFLKDMEKEEAMEGHTFFMPGIRDQT